MSKFLSPDVTTFFFALICLASVHLDYSQTNISQDLRSWTMSSNWKLFYTTRLNLLKKNCMKNELAPFHYVYYVSAFISLSKTLNRQQSTSISTLDFLWNLYDASMLYLSSAMISAGTPHSCDFFLMNCLESNRRLMNCKKSTRRVHLENWRKEHR